ncbi:hypothetical protein DH2020_038051 [Rehmannia glutinosa]|uniref:Flavin-containing monooxygenase n=1 Tax=Rehmannia glutinosa TaxID=99300 RepID=A0ABR0UZW3_REHGL
MAACENEIGIIGGGISGLLACKYTLSKRFNPIVFESRNKFSDFPWPLSVAQDFPTQKQVLKYIQSYAHNHDLLKYVKLDSRVVSLSYDENGPSEEEMQKWTLWGGTCELSDVPKENGSDFPNMPEFPRGKGPQVFQGKVMHSMDYSSMDHASAARLIQGKRVAVVGNRKSGMDISMECSSANDCIYIYIYTVDGINRATEHWNMPAHSPWGITVEYLSRNRFSQLLVHKPGEGILLSILATFLSPLRWSISKFVESHIRKKLRLAKHGMVPNHSFSKPCSTATVPEGFFDRVEQGSIILKKTQHFSFCSQGIVVDGETEPLKIDLLILATSFRGIDKLKAAFISPAFRDLMDKEDTTRLPLYRACVHPRIPQVAFVGFAESFANLFTSEMTCRWLAELLDGTFMLPSVKEMEKDVSQLDKYMKKSLGEYYSRYCLDEVQIWYNDQLCKDMGWKPQ